MLRTVPWRHLPPRAVGMRSAFNRRGKIDRSQIFKKRQALQGKVDQLEEELEAVDQEINRLELLTQEGYSVAGKRPEAVFLNQVARRLFEV